MIKISKTSINFEREPLKAPLGFKGGYLTELWQTVALLESAGGHAGMGLGTQSTLWSDAGIFSAYPESAGNALMLLMTAFALKSAREIPFETPLELLEKLLPLTWKYGKTITNRRDLRLTFALNALVALDNAAWQLYARENEIARFNDLIPANLRPALAQHQAELAAIPLMSYKVPLETIRQAVADGFFFLKIKIGCDPDGDGDQEKMLAWDKARLSAIHAAIGSRTTAHTADGHIPYYLDANGRYAGKDRLLRLLDHAAKIGALDRIILLEEPFPEELEIDVHDIPARLAADESAHSDKDALARIEMGYRAIALKPIAKTMSMSLKIAKVAHDRNVPCFCADLTVNPLLVDWNKNVAARLKPLPGMKIGVLETNGHQNYRNWEAMQSYHPCCHAPWTEQQLGIFRLSDDFYARNGGILEDSKHYLDLVRS